MKTTVSIIRAIVGILFIVSGLVKANDPLGLSYKMQEFFEIWNMSLSASGFFLKTPLINLFEWLHEHSLALSIIMITLEIMAGVALLIGWRKKLVLYSLFVLIVFFTFLTAYAYLSGKFKNCGCFGDCLPIEPFTSFMKDLILFVMIVFLIGFNQYIRPLFTAKLRSATLVALLVASLGLQWFVLNYLPLVDCLPYKKGNNITQNMQVPAGAVPDSFAIRFVYQKGGKEFEFSPESLPADLGTYQFVDRVDRLVRKGNAEPPIKGFALKGTEMDSTAVVLNEPKAYLLFWESVEPGKENNWINNFKALKASAQRKNIPVYIVTPAPDEAGKTLNKHQLGDIAVFSCDNTAVRTAARTNPALYFLEKGTILNKYSYRQIEEAADELKNL